MFFEAFTPFLVAHGKDTDLRETSQERVFERLPVTVHQIFFPFGKTVVSGWTLIGLLT